MQEKHYKNQGIKTLKGRDIKYRLYWKDDDTANGSVKLMLKQEFATSIMDDRKISPRILSVDHVLFGKVVTIISVDGSQSGRREFCNNLSAEMQKIKITLYWGILISMLES